ncbi:hypothetical protein DACRYDRAFT_117574 [Dacryopinax primogenitus]|uniref:C3H1-type domain-containing protein n=1 Tax=Dacryopinax primogenitus (strain DJM 731) TaxID=1858805 RepID=M5FRU6_DACPD|nr:uncharacterized protein DACRYDRAFT_117574 [Dacryopinax primogenitus]EJT99955.1 hypothetical protein DACRYDRAFT_117574 [Dacryopinax primogenitus]
MVSPLWRAASDGDLEKVQELLKEASSVDVEIKDHTGATPLIQAIRNGHVEVVRVMLDNGADPNNNSAQGRPDVYTEDPTILELLVGARAKLEAPAPAPAVPTAVSANYVSYEQVSYAAYPQAYYSEGLVPPPYPAYPYMYRPDMIPAGMVISSAAPPPAPAVSEQTAPAPSLPQQASQSPVQRSENSSAGLPPPEIAKTIPCRFYPACRYGAQCIFAHPDPAPASTAVVQPAPTPVSAPTYAYPMAPLAYSYGSPPYDPSTMTYGPYYAMTAPAMPAYAPMAAMTSPPFSAAPGVPHQRSSSDVHTPISATFSPVTNPVLAGMWPVGVIPPISPYVQPAMGQAPPMSPVEATHGVNGASPHPMAPPSPTTFYNPAADVSIPTAPAAHRRSFSTPRALDGFGQLQMPDGIPQPETQNITTMYFRGSSRGRGGKRSSYLPGQRQPASNVVCLFFPTGKCKNGPDCRFAHVMPGPDDPPPVHPRTARARAAALELDRQASFPTINEPVNVPNGHGYPRNGSGNGSSPSSQNGAFDKLRAMPNGKHGAATAGSSRSSSAAPVNRQRIPNADDFPALGGPGAGPNGVKPIAGPAGPTAAQVLQAPAPAPRSTSKPRTQSETSSEKATKIADDIADVTSKLEAVKIESVTASLPRPPTPARESDAVFA